MATASIVFRKLKLNKKNEAPIYYRIIIDRKAKYISSKVKVHKDDWDYVQNKVKPKHKNSKRINALLTTKLAAILDDLYEHEQHNETINVENLKTEIKPKASLVNYIDYAQQDLEDYLRNQQIGTYHKNKSVIKKMIDYLHGKKLYFHEITPQFLVNYENHLRTMDKPNKTNTIIKDIKYHKKLFNKAIKQGLIKSEDNPFNLYTIRPEKTERVFLTAEELKLLEEYEATPGTKLELHRDMFVFACYAGGIRVSDVLKLRWKDYDGYKLYITMKKTKNPIAIKVIEKPRKILDKYRTPNSKPNDFIFPMLPNGLDLNDERALDTAISRATAYINKNLKILEEKVDLGKHISFHISRHTFATLAISLGIPMEMVAKILGHTSLREVQVYAKIMSKNLDEAMDVFDTLNK